MWNRVKYFITGCSTSWMSVLLSARRFGLSLWHYSFQSYKMCYSTSSHISTFVTPLPPRQRRFPAEITARWRYGPPIKNMTAHYNSQFCVSVHCYLIREAKKRLTALSGIFLLLFTIQQVFGWKFGWTTLGHKIFHKKCPLNILYFLKNNYLTSLSGRFFVFFIHFVIGPISYRKSSFKILNVYISVKRALEKLHLHPQ